MIEAARRDSRRKLLPERAIVRQLGRDQLQRDGPVERELGRSVDDPHAAATDHTVDPVAGQLSFRAPVTPQSRFSTVRSTR